MNVVYLSLAVMSSTVMRGLVALDAGPLPSSTPVCELQMQVKHPIDLNISQHGNMAQFTGLLDSTLHILMLPIALDHIHMSLLVLDTCIHCCRLGSS